MGRVIRNLGQAHIAVEAQRVLETLLRRSTAESYLLALEIPPYVGAVQGPEFDDMNCCSNGWR